MKTIFTIAYLLISGISFGQRAPELLELANPLIWPPHITIGPQGHLYAIDAKANTVYKVDRITKHRTEILDSTASLAQPVAIAVDAKQNVFICDRGRVLKWTNATNALTTIAGSGWPGNGGNEGLARESDVNPSGVAVDSLGRVFINDIDIESGAKRLRMIDSGLGLIQDFGPGADVLLGSYSDRMYLFERDELQQMVFLVAIDTAPGEGPVYTTDFRNALTANDNDLPPALEMDQLGHLRVAPDYADHVHSLPMCQHDCAPKGQLHEAESSSFQPAFEFYPNPTRGQIFIQGDGMESGTVVTVRNLQGQVIQSMTAQAATAVMNLDSVTQPGIYLLQFYQKGALKVSKKLVYR